MEKHWSVEIKINGENVLYISHNELSGIDDVEKYADEIRMCAKHLLAFIGTGKSDGFFDISEG
jgi:hypothetical protein